MLYFCTPPSIIFYPLFCRRSFICGALLFPLFLSVSLSLSRRDFLSSPLFPLTLSFTVHHPVLYSNTDTGLGAHKEPTHPSPSGPPITCHTHHLALKAVLLRICFPSPSAAFLPFFSPFLPPSTKTPLLLLFLLFRLLPILLLTPQAWRSFLCS